MSRFIGVLEAASEPYQDTSRIWSDEDFPCRVQVKVVSALTVRIQNISDALGLNFPDYAAAETFYLGVAHDCGIDGWTLDRLLYGGRRMCSKRSERR